MALIELNADGLVGPTHNYAGLARGNLASITHEGTVSHPRQAALQGLAKMRAVAELGVPQLVLPPHERPDVRFLRAVGFDGSDAQVIERAGRDATRILAAASSASPMWAANAATVAPSVDAEDGRMHLTPANLVSTLHRSLEPVATGRALRRILPGPHFVVHAPLPASAALADEGAANHTRLAADRGPGVHLFTFGRSSLQTGLSAPTRHPARQTLEAARAIARRHRLDPGRVLYAQQHPDAIDHGVFHNDVIAVGHGPVLLFHERAWVDGDSIVERLARALDGALVALRVADDELPLTEAVETYLFNSQIVTAADGRTVLIAPAECERSPRARAVLDRIVTSPDNPITETRIIDLRQSMRNGGGPACLRLRLPLDDAERAAVHTPCLLDATLAAALEEWVRRHYRETLAPDDLRDPHLLDESRTALDELSELLKLGSDFYGFQRVG